MGNIIDFPTTRDYVKTFLDSLDEDVPILLAYKKDGEVCTGWWKASLVERQELISHLQIDVIMGVVEKNLRG